MLRLVTYLVIGVALLVVSAWTLHEQAPIHLWAAEALAFETDPVDYDLFIAADISGGLYLIYRAFRAFMGM
jgi:hypothetical protein